MSDEDCKAGKKKMLLTMMLKKSTDGNFQNSPGQQKDDVLHGNAV